MLERLNQCCRLYIESSTRRGFGPFPVPQAVDNLTEAAALYLVEEFGLATREAPLVTTFTVPQSARLKSVSIVSGVSTWCSYTS